MSGRPLITVNLRDQVAEQLRIDILCGRFSDGARLSEVDLASRFGVSRTPIREALQQLTYEGLLESRPNAGVSVTFRAPQAIRELVVPIRRTVEIFALRTCFRELGENDFALWEDVLLKMKLACETQDYSAIAEQDLAFHRAIIRRAQQRDLEAIWTPLVARVRHHFWETQSRFYPDPLAIHAEHADLLRVFREGDVESAVEALSQNIA